MTGSCSFFPIISNQCVILSRILLSWQFQSTILSFLVLSSGWCFSRALGQFLPGDFITTSVIEHRRAMIKASKRRCLIGTGYAWLDICNKYLMRAFSSDGVRCCWLFALSSIERRPCAWWYKVERGTLPHFDRARSVLGSPAGRPSTVPVLDWRGPCYCDYRWW